MRAELLTIGSELTSGAMVNTNAAYLARRLAELGISCQRQVAVSDDRGALAAALREALGRADVVLCTGGLGPTFDDVTLDVVADVAARPLIHHPRVAASIRRFYSRRHRHLQRAALRQALLPRGGHPLANPLGTAPGMWMLLDRKLEFIPQPVRGSGLRALGSGPSRAWSSVSLGPCPEPRTLNPEPKEVLGQVLLIALPGVPREMRAIMEQQVVPRLRRHAPHHAIETLTLRTAGIVELSIERLLHRLRLPRTVEIGLYPHLRMVDVRLTTTAPSARAARRLVTHAAGRLRRTLGADVYGVDQETLEGVIGELLVRQGRTLAVAESCTGGLVTDRLTNIPGSSRYLRGALVAYHNDLKRGPLGVPGKLLARHGAVSAPVARAMAAGVRRFANANVGLSITGIAGPAGGSAAKPVGLVCFGLSDRRHTLSRAEQFFGDRESIKAQAAQTALDWLRRTLQAR